MLKYLWYIPLTGLIFLEINAYGNIKLPSIIGNNMVLQQQSAVPLWGLSNANTTVSVVTSWNHRTYSTSSDAVGHWRLKVNTVIVTFTNTPHGFTSWDKEINGFEPAGSDKIFYPAKAKIYKNSIEVKCDKVPHPLAVRYAFKDWVTGDLYNTAGLPAGPFRSDHW